MKISKYCGTCKFNIQGEINKKAGVVNFKCELSIKYFNEDFNVSENVVAGNWQNDIKIIVGEDDE